MKGNVSRTPIPLELDVQRRRMSRKDQSRRIPLRAISITRRPDRSVNSQLRADLRTTAAERTGFPDGETARIAVVGVVLGALGVVEVTVIVHLFGRVVGVDVFPAFRDIVSGVLDGPDAAC